MSRNRAHGASEAETGAAQPTVLMLGGFGRSGSTLLERCLAQCPNVTGLGEVLHLWERGLRDNELCGCSLPFADCPFWQEVGREAYGGWDKVTVQEVIEDRTSVVRNRYLGGLITGWSPRRRRIRRRRFLEALNALYFAAQTVGVSRLLIDSSKHPAYAYLLRSAAVNLKCVLLVRDPRGVAYSWSKVVKRPETDASDAYMPRYSTTAAVGNWCLYGLLFHALTLLRVDVRTVHYEDFMVDPRKVVDEILEFAGLSPAETSTAHIRSDAVDLDPHHTVAGNPMRFQIGRLTIRKDSAWRDEMPARERRVAGIVSYPLRLAYGLRRFCADARKSNAASPSVEKM